MATDDRLRILLQAYATERADDTPATATFVSLLAAMLGLLTIIGFAFIHADTVPAWAIALAPVPPLPFVAFGTIAAYAADLRGVVIDAYESELRQFAHLPDRIDDPVPYGHTVLNRMVWQSAFGRVALAIAFLALFPLYVGVLILAYRYSHAHEFWIALTSLVGCSTALSVLLISFAVVLRSHGALERALQALRDDRDGHVQRR